MTKVGISQVAWATMAAAALLATGEPARAQRWDRGGGLGGLVSAETGSKLKIGAEFRSRYESRTGMGFGRETDVDAVYLRTRLSLSYTPVSWIRFSGMLQDSRAPLYGYNAPATARDTADLHEGFVELYPERKTGFGLQAGRAMLNYGEGRLIGTPQWGNLSRSYDHARMYYRTGRARVELLFVSPVKVRIGEFNQPVLGDHIWGAYNVFPNLVGRSLVEAYFLRRDQNRPGGFTGGSRAAGTDKLGVNTFGFRMAGPLARGIQYSAEGALQNGTVGPASHRGGAWVSGVTRRWTAFGKPLDVGLEYKFASGTRNPADTSRVGTFDQLYAAFHDRFGHQDLFGWRNIHSVRSLAVLGVNKRLAFNLMYDSFWLASARDALYNGSGKAIVRSATGTAGRHVGQEPDVFATYKYGRFTVGAGFGYFLIGTFISNTTPGVNPVYVYVFQAYSL